MDSEKKDATSNFTELSVEKPGAAGIFDPEGYLSNPDAHLTEEEQLKLDKELVRKLDWRLLPWLSVLYLMSFLDRTNAGNAKIEGIQTDLHMSDNMYNAALCIFFVAYALLEPLTNVCLKLFRPPVFLSVIIILWATCMTLMGFCHNGSGLMAGRFFLGMCEAGLFPGVNYLLSCWYRRSEIGVRMAIFFSAAALAGSFGGLLASAIVNMDGMGGRPGWAWIFILEGLATFLCGIVSFWAVPPFPDEAHFLSAEDRARVRYRLAKDAQSSAKHEEFNMSYFWASVKDWKTYTGAITYMGCDGPLYGYSQFLPTIIKQIGYASTKAQLMSVPPYAVAAVATVSVGLLADKIKQRGICNMCIAVVGIAGFVMMMASEDPAVKYAGTFLGALGIYPAIPNTIAWSSNNVEGVYKRGVTIGFVIGWGNLQGIVSSNIYRSQDKPQFYLGHGVILAYLTLFSFLGSLVQYVLLSRENKKRRRGERDAEVENMSQEELMRRGDNRPDFLYTL
ncbi:hypothetical protein KEM52_005232 [Ascosphaera acerosa]|nr:hypothetical protein KEM52_005232 [Ascosphaera acerosa]